MFNEDRDAHESEHLRWREYGRVVTALPPAANWPGGRVNYLNLDWYSDGTQWLTVQQYNLTLAPRLTQPFAATTQALDAVIPNYNASGIYLERVDGFFFPNTAQSGANFYTITIGIYNASTGATSNLTLTGTQDTKLLTTALKGYPFSATFTPLVLPANSFTLSATMTPTGAPGTFYFWATATYRRVG